MKTTVAKDKTAASKMQRMSWLQPVEAAEGTFTNELRWGTQDEYDADPQGGVQVLDSNDDPIDGVLAIIAANFEGCDKDSRKGKYNVYYTQGGTIKIGYIYDDTAGVEDRGFFIANASCDPTEPEPEDQDPVFGCLAADGCKEVAKEDQQLTKAS